MICMQCRAAGSVNKSVNSGEIESTTGQITIERLHGECKGGTWCDCQHIIGKVLNDGHS